MASATTEVTPTPQKRAQIRPALAAGAIFALATPLLLLFYARHPLLYDTDSSYHLAIARLTAQHGIVRDLPAIRRSALTAHGFADSVLLFHLLLAPFAGGGDPLVGGRHALALLDAAVLALLGGLGWRSLGRWGALLPLWVGVGSLEVAWRLVRLRPELLALVLLLAAVAAAGSGRYRLLGGIAALFALAYVAWHAFLGLFVLLFGFRGWARRRWDWALLLYPLLGTLIGLRLHPAFPQNLVLWKLAALDVLSFRQGLDGGTELGPDTLDVVALANLGFWLVAAALWRARAPRSTADAGAGDLADAFGVAALSFGALFLTFSRFALYAFPLAALWLCFSIAARGQAIGSRTRLPFRGTAPLSAVLVVIAVLALPGTVQELHRFDRRTDPAGEGPRLADRVALARQLPRGARVAAPWRDTPSYLLWAPQGRYLNVLDPVAMALPYPREYAAQRAIFDGTEPDVPLAAVVDLDSDFVAWSLPGAPRRLLDRLSADPRAVPLHLGFQALFALHPAPAAFILDWRVPPAGVLPPPSNARLDDWTAYPRHPCPAGRAMEGYVDVRRLALGRCVALVHEQGPGEAGEHELAASGPASLWADATPLLSVGGGGGAVVGQGVRITVAAGVRRLTVLTCPGTDGRAGFYWRALVPAPRSADSAAGREGATAPR